MNATRTVVTTAALAVCAITCAAEAGLTAYRFRLAPLNDSGIRGGGMITVDDDNTVTVQIQAYGLEADMPHMQSIHAGGFTLDHTLFNSGIPDTNGNGFIEYDEGTAFYGDALMPLTMPQTPIGQAADMGNFPSAPGGIVNFLFTYHFDSTNIDESQLLSDLLLMPNRALVLHGMTVDLNGDGFAAYDATLPVAIGIFQPLPAPGALALLGIALITPCRRRRR